MQKIVKGMKRMVKTIDVFASPIQFNFDGKEQYKSFVGGLCTIIVTFLIIVSFQSQIVVFSNKETIYYDQSSIFKNDPIKLVLDNTFLFAIKVEQNIGSSYAQNPYFIINVTQNKYHTQNKTTERQTVQIPLEPCQVERFTELNEDLNSTFYNYNLSDFLCPVKNMNMSLQGAFLSEQFDFLRFDVVECNGYTNRETWNVTCASQAEKSAYLTDNGQYRLVIYSTNYVINPSKASNYYHLYLAEDLNFLFQPDIRQTVNVFFKQYEVKTDQSLFLDSNVDTKTFIYRKERTYNEETTLDLSKKSQLVVYFRSDYFNDTANRKFMKIDQLFAYFGGIFNIFLLIFGIFVKSYNSMFYKLKMANHLYQFPEIEPPPRHIDQRKVLIESIRSQQLTLKDIRNSGLLKEHGFKSKIDFLYTYFKEVITRTISVYPKMSYLIYLITFRKKCVNLRNRLIDKSLDQINRDINVRILIKKILEIEKLKQIFLDENQLQLFNFMKRPQIKVVQTDEQMTISSFNKLYASLDRKTKGEQHFQDLINSYKAILSIEDKQSEQYFVSQRLIELIGVQMNDLLHCAVEEKYEQVEVDQENQPLMHQAVTLKS